MFLNYSINHNIKQFNEHIILIKRNIGEVAECYFEVSTCDEQDKYFFCFFEIFSYICILTHKQRENILSVFKHEMGYLEREM